ncbi:MAG: ArsR/SmtB family transcription factor [Bacteroidia bacterium]
MMRRDVFQAIADPKRRAILELLSSQQLSLNGIAENFKVSRPAVSKHIRILYECGLVSIRQQGRERYCRVNPGKIKEVYDWAGQYRHFWNKKLDALENYLATVGKPVNKRRSEPKKRIKNRKLKNKKNE